MKEDVAKKLDISKNEDLCVGVMNLISLEEHLAFTALKTGKEEYKHVLSAVREVRKRLMKKLVKNTEGQMWCISKHLLAATMRLLETGEKCMGNDDKEANEFFKDAYDTYSLFWFLQKMGSKNDVEKTGKKT